MPLSHEPKRLVEKWLKYIFMYKKYGSRIWLTHTPCSCFISTPQLLPQRPSDAPSRTSNTVNRQRWCIIYHRQRDLSCYRLGLSVTYVTIFNITINLIIRNQVIFCVRDKTLFGVSINFFQYNNRKQLQNNMDMISQTLFGSLDSRQRIDHIPPISCIIIMNIFMSWKFETVEVERQFFIFELIIPFEHVNFEHIF